MGDCHGTTPDGPIRPMTPEEDLILDVAAIVITLPLGGEFVLGARAGMSASMLPRSGAIGRSVGAMSRAERLARKLSLNINSPTTRQVLNSLDDTVGSFVSQFRKGSIHRELPREVLDMTVEEALQHSSTVRKLLIDSRFVK